MPLLNLLFGGGLVTKIVVVILLCGLLVCGGGLVYKSIELGAANHKISSLEVKAQQQNIDIATLKQNVDTITKVYQANLEANKKLLEERHQSQIAIANLAKQRAANKKKLDLANKKIDEMLKDPKNNGTVAPVLRETIRGIQGDGK